MIDEEIEAAETELKNFQKENRKDIKSGFIWGGLLSGVAVAAAPTVWMPPISPIAGIAIATTFGIGAGNIVASAADMLIGKIKEFSLHQKISKLKRMKQAQRDAQNRNLRHENSRTGRGALYEEQKLKENQLQELREKANKSIDNCKILSYAALATTCLVSPFFGPAAIASGLTYAAIFSGAAIFKSIRATIKGRAIKKQIKAQRVLEDDRSYSPSITKRMNNLSNNGSRPINRSHLRVKCHDLLFMFVL